jgi:hypothetical protein
MGTGTFASIDKHTFNDEDFEVSPDSYKRAIKYTADGPQDEMVIGSGSYFKDIISVRNAATLSNPKESYLKGLSSVSSSIKDGGMKGSKPSSYIAGKQSLSS